MMKDAHWMNKAAAEAAAEDKAINDLIRRQRRAIMWGHERRRQTQFIRRSEDFLVKLLYSIAPLTPFYELETIPERWGHKIFKSHDHNHC